MGQKYIEPFKFNSPECTLEFILKKIKIDNDESYYHELLNDEDVIRLVNQFTNRYSFGQQGFLISRDVVKGLIEEELMMLTWKDFKIWLCAQDNIKNGYLAFIYKFLPKKMSEAIKNERPGKILKETNEQIKKEDLIKEDYEYIEILSGDISNLEIINDYLQEMCDQYYKQIENDDKFEELISCLTENQKDILRKKYKEKYTEREIAKEHNVAQVSINYAKKRAIRKLRKKLGGYQN